MCGRISRLEEQISCRDRIYRECSKAAISVLEGEGKYNNVGELRYHTTIKYCCASRDPQGQIDAEAGRGSASVSTKSLLYALLVLLYFSMQ